MKLIIPESDLQHLRFTRVRTNQFRSVTNQSFPHAPAFLPSALTILNLLLKEQNMKITVMRDEMIGNGLDQVSIIEVKEFCGAVIRPCNGPGHGTDLTFEEAVEAVKTGAEYESWTLTEEECNAVEKHIQKG